MDARAVVLRSQDRRELPGVLRLVRLVELLEQPDQMVEVLLRSGLDRDVQPSQLRPLALDAVLAYQLAQSVAPCPRDPLEPERLLRRQPWIAMSDVPDEPRVPAG